MAIQEREVIMVGNVSEGDLAKARMEAEKAEYKARIASVYDRGFINLRFNVELPEDTYGEWFSNDPVAIARAQLVGFTEDTVHAAKHALHSDGTGRAIVGDTIFMTIPKWKKEILDGELRSRVAAKSAMMTPAGKRGGIEEREGSENLDTKTIPLTNDSSMETVSLKEVADSLFKHNN